MASIMTTPLTELDDGYVDVGAELVQLAPTGAPCNTLHGEQAPPETKQDLIAKGLPVEPQQEFPPLLKMTASLTAMQRTRMQAQREREAAALQRFTRELLLPRPDDRALPVDDRMCNLRRSCNSEKAKPYITMQDHNHT
jgi:hypothetical protein